MSAAFDRDGNGGASLGARRDGEPHRSLAGRASLDPVDERRESSDPDYRLSHARDIQRHRRALAAGFSTEFMLPSSFRKRA